MRDMRVNIEVDFSRPFWSIKNLTIGILKLIALIIGAITMGVPFTVRGKVDDDD